MWKWFRLNQYLVFVGFAAFYMCLGYMLGKMDERREWQTEALKLGYGEYATEIHPGHHVVKTKFRWKEE